MSISHVIKWRTKKTQNKAERVWRRKAKRVARRITRRNRKH